MFCAELLDGKEISRLERQFLVSWKASREARRKQKVEKFGTNDEPGWCGW